MIVLGIALAPKIVLSIIVWTAAGLFFLMAAAGMVGDDVDLSKLPRVPQLAIRLVVLGVGVFFALVPILAFVGVISWTELTNGMGGG
jgi:hypothetical protein